VESAQGSLLKVVGGRSVKRARKKAEKPALSRQTWGKQRPRPAKRVRGGSIPRLEEEKGRVDPFEGGSLLRAGNMKNSKGNP